MNYIFRICLFVALMLELSACSLFDFEELPSEYTFRWEQAEPIIRQEFFQTTLHRKVYAGDTLSFSGVLELNKLAIVDSIKVYKRIVPANESVSRISSNSRFKLVESNEMILNFDQTPQDDGVKENGNRISIMDGVHGVIYYSFDYQFVVPDEDAGKPVQYVFVPFCSNIPSSFTVLNGGEAIEGIRQEGNPPIFFDVEEPRVLENVKLYNVKGTAMNCITDYDADKNSPRSVEDIHEGELLYNPSRYSSNGFEFHSTLLLNYFDEENLDSKAFVHGLQVPYFYGKDHTEGWIVKMPSTVSLSDQPSAIMAALGSVKKEDRLEKVNNLEVGDICLVHMPYTNPFSSSNNATRFGLVEVMDIVDDGITSDEGGSNHDYLLLNIKLFSPYWF